jgi:hypothetical protein
VTVELPGAGTLQASGRSIAVRLVAGGAHSSAVSTTVSSPRLVKLLVRPEGKLKAKLDRKGSAKGRLMLAFTPTNGPPARAAMTIRFRKKG